MASSSTISGPPSESSLHILAARPSEEKIHACQRLGELFGLTVPATEQVCFEAAWEMCKARDWTLLKRCQEELNHIVNEQGRSLLQQAIRVGEIALATEMIANGIAIHVRDAAGNTAMHYAVQTESLDLISKLYEHISQDAQNFHGQTPLHFAAARGQLDIVRTLIANGANVSASTQVPIHDLNANASMLIGDLTLPNLTPLAFAAIRGDRDCVDLFLLENQRNPVLNLNLRFGTMGNLVHLLITFHHNHLFKFLLQKHNEQIFPLLDERNARGLTPLMLAAYLGEEEALVLLRDKVNLEATDFLGRTAVHHATLGRQKKSLAYLHSFGVNLMVLDADNKIPLNMLHGCDDAESLSVVGYLSNLCKHKAKTQHAPPNFIAAPPENLVFKGNDPTGLAYLGVIKTLEKNGDISGIRRVAGSSTGTLLAMLFAIGCTFDEMTSKARFLSSFFDSPIAGQAISKISKSAPQVATLRRLLDITQKNSLLGKDQYKTLHQLPSLCSGKVLLDWIEERIYEKTGIHDCTFGELKRLVKTNPQFKDLTVFTTRFGDTLTSSRFSSEDAFSDDIVISHVVCAALSIPGIYPLKTLYTKNTAGGVDESPSLGRYGDAATINNFPIEAYDFEKFQNVMPLEEEAGAYFRLNKRTLGFALEAGGRNHSFSEMATVQECLEKVLELYCQMEPSTQQTTLYNDFRVVQFKNPTSLDRDLGFLSMPKKMQMHLMIQIGEEATMEFLEEQKRSASSINPFLLMSERTNRGMKWTNLKSPLPYFVGRTQQIQTLKEKLISDISSTVSSSSCTSSSSSSSSSSCSTSLVPSQKRSCVVLAGAGGMGKSETAIAFAHQYRDNFSVVWWIETATPQSMDRSFRKLAEALDIYVEPSSSTDTIRQRIYHFLKTENLGKPYLLIFDNAEEVIELPQGGHGCILVTTTQPGHFFSEEILPIMPLTEDESITLIAGILKQEPNEEMKRLAAEVEYLPAILSQAAQYIRTTPGMTLQKYLDLLSKEKIQVLSMMPVDSRYSKAQLSTWRVTHETLMHQYPIAYEWLEICAFLQPDAIPSSYLETWLENFKGEHDYVTRSFKKDQILRTLVNAGILRYDEKSDSFSLHRIRQEMMKQLSVASEAIITQDGLSSSSSTSSSQISVPPSLPSRQTAIALLATIVNRLNLETTDDWIALASHEVQLSAILETMNEETDGDENMALISHLLGRWRLIQFPFESEGLQLLKKALKIRKRLFPGDHPDLARSFDWVGKINDNESYIIRAYEMRTRLYQGAHPEIAASLLRMAKHVSESKQSRKYALQGILMMKQLYPDGHPSLAFALLKLVKIIGDKSDKQGGIILDALKMLENASSGNYSRNNSSMVRVLKSLAEMNNVLGRSDEALNYYHRAVDICIRINPHDERIHFYFWEMCDIIQTQRHQAVKAWKNYEQILTKFATINPTYSQLHVFFKRLSHLKLPRSNLAEPIAFLTQYVESYGVPGNNVNMANALLHLGVMNYVSDKYALALEQLWRSLSFFAKDEEGGSLEKAVTLGHIGIVQQGMNNHLDAVANLKLAIEMLKSVNCELTRPTFRFLTYLGNSFKALGKNQEAKEAFNNSSKIEKQLIAYGVFWGDYAHEYDVFDPIDRENGQEVLLSEGEQGLKSNVYSSQDQSLLKKKDCLIL